MQLTDFNFRTRQFTLSAGTQEAQDLIALVDAAANGTNARPKHTSYTSEEMAAIISGAHLAAQEIQERLAASSTSTICMKARKLLVIGDLLDAYLYAPQAGKKTSQTHKAARRIHRIITNGYLRLAGCGKNSPSDFPFCSMT